MFNKAWPFLAFIFVIFDDVPDSLTRIFYEEDKGHEIEINRIKIYVLASWVVIFFVVLFTVIYFFSKPTVFLVTANVEQVSVAPYKDNSSKEIKYPKLRISNAVLHPDCGEDSSQVSGVLFPASNVYIEFLRIQNHELTINLDNEDGDPTGFFVDDNNKSEKIELKDCSTIRIPINDGDSYIYPIEGKIRLGGDIKEGVLSVPILNSGNVVIMDKEIMSRVYYSVGPFDLKMGDVFVVEDLSIQSSGFIHVDDEKGMSITYSSKGGNAYIQSYRTEKIEIKNGFWTKVYNDQSLFYLWVIAFFLFSICKSLIRNSLSKI